MITLLLLVRATYTYGVVLHAHSIRGESHNQRNTTGEVATPLHLQITNKHNQEKKPYEDEQKPLMAAFTLFWKKL